MRPWGEVEKGLKEKMGPKQKLKLEMDIKTFLKKEYLLYFILDFCCFIYLEMQS